MDACQFDRWTRVFSGATRRQAITMLVAGMSGGLLATGENRDVFAQVSADKCKSKGDNCNNNNDCCNNLKCKNGRCKKDNKKNNCKKKGDNCNKTKDCCNQLKCKSGKCKKAN